MTCTVKGCENTAIARGLCPCTTCGRGAQVTPSQSVSQYDRLSLTGTPKWWRSCEPRTWICGGGFGPHKRGSETSKRIEDPWFAGRFFCFVSNLATRTFIRVVGIATSLQDGALTSSTRIRRPAPARWCLRSRPACGRRHRDRQRGSTNFIWPCARLLRIRGINV